MHWWIFYFLPVRELFIIYIHVLDLSWPHIDKTLVDLDGDKPVSINAGIDLSDFPVKMISINDILRIVNRAGPTGWMTKQDWSDAYKHVHVCPSDLSLQAISMGGKIFIERGLTFGCSSSPHLYDIYATLLKHLSILQSGANGDNLAKQLDDLIMVDTKDEVCRWRQTYRDLATRVGVKLAPEMDDKAISCAQEGTLLGVHFDLPNWRWSLSERKVSVILELLFKIVVDGNITAGELSSLAGKLTHYYPLFVPGKWERSFILHAVNNDVKKSTQVSLDKNIVSQSGWWIRRLSAASECSTIPLPFPCFPSHSWSLYPDASGGGHFEGCRGIGGVVWDVSPKIFTMIPYGDMIRYNAANRVGVKLASKLTFLEACAGLLLLCSDPDTLRNRSLVIRTDNMGLVWCWKKGNSKCLYTYTVCHAMDTVARSMGVKLDVQKVARCSNRGSVTADLLSKGMIQEAWEVMEDCRAEPGYVPLTLVSWMEDPVPCRTLGGAIVKELATRFDVLDMEAEWNDELDLLCKIRKFY